MKEIVVITKPKLSFKVRNTCLAIGVFVLIFILGQWLDSQEFNLSPVWGILMVFFLFVWALFAIKVNTILAPRKTLSHDLEGVSISKGERIEVYMKWDEIKEIYLFPREFKLFIAFVSKQGEETEVELIGKWVFSAFNSGKTIQFNHDKLMQEFGRVEQFTNLINLGDYEILVREFIKTKPDWYEKRMLQF